MPVQRSPKPDWLRIRMPSGQELFNLRKELHRRNLHTICEDARCPNMWECWNRNHATFLILGNVCTRNCGFCSVKTGKGEPPDIREPEKIAEMVRIMGLEYAVITSVTRDDLEDGGASHYVRVIEKLRKEFPDLRIEVLIPDFKGEKSAVDAVLQARPDVLNHNIETVRALYPAVNRNADNYDVSLSVLEYAAASGRITKSGIMLGMGETDDQVRELFSDLLRCGVNILTIGQYLRPDIGNVEVREFIRPEKFAELKHLAESMGFSAVESGPFVRSSYNAAPLFIKAGSAKRNRSS